MVMRFASHLAIAHMNRILSTAGKLEIEIQGIPDDKTDKRQFMKKLASKKAPRAKTPGKTVKFLQKSTCGTCRKARRFMEKHGYKLNYRDIVKERLGPSELENLIGRHDHEEFLNPRSE